VRYFHADSADFADSCIIHHIQFTILSSVPELVEGGAIPAFRFNLFLAEKARKRISTAIGARVWWNSMSSIQYVFAINYISLLSYVIS